MTAVGVLGPLLLNGPDGPVRLGSVLQRRLLAALVAHLGRVVPPDVLADLVWGGAPPADVTGPLHSHVARLRKLLPEDVRIATTATGYQLVVDRGRVDVAAFADRLAAATEGRPELRPQRLAAALELWRGPPYAELDHASLGPEIARLTALRSGAVEQYAEALLAAGRVAEAIAEAEALAVAEPLREGAVAVLMRALVAAGRQGDALAAFHRLRARLADELGLDPASGLRALEEQVLRQEVPVVAAPSAPALPLPVSSFVGRAAAVDEATALLGHARVVTLRGPGGVGKTRLALHVAAAAAPRYADGVLLVELAEGGPVDVEPALARAVRLADAGPAGEASFLARLVEVLSVRSQLLLLDNCEHVADEVAAVVEAIAAGAPGVDLLLTSREPLRVDGEHVLAVEPLDPEAARGLLADRMRAAGRPVGPGADETLVAELCRRMDALPLALELAAPRAVSLGLPGLLDALDALPEASLDVLRGGRRTASARHRSLREVVAWSHGLLDERQRALFERLAVFAGPVELAAVAAVCGDAGPLPDLVERSLVVRRSGEPARFGMLDTLRAFGRSRLATGGGSERLRDRHAAWAVRLAEEVAAGRRGPGEAAAIRRFDAHLPDLRRAHAWLCEVGPLEDLLRLTVPIGELAHVRSRIDLARLVEEALTVAGVLGDEPGRVSHPLAARLLGQLATSWWQRGDLRTAEEYARRAIDIAEAAGEPVAARDGYMALSNVHGFRGRLDEALHAAHRSLLLAQDAGDLDGQVLALADLVLTCVYAGDQDGADRYEETMGAVQAALGSATSAAFLSYVRGERRAELGDPGATRHLERAIGVADGIGADFVAGIARHTLLTSAARRAPDPDTALAAFGRLLDHWHGFGAWTQLWIAMRALVATLSRFGRHADAAVLIGALRTSATSSAVFGADATRVLGAEQAARDALGPAFATAWADGAALGDAGAVALARRLTRPPRGPAPATGSDLTAGEQRVDTGRS